MFKRALISMDLSPATEALVASLPGLLDYGVSSLVLVHVAKPVEYPVSQAIAEVEQIRQRLARLKASLEGKGFSDIEIDVPIGVASAEIVREAAERAVDLVIIGSRGYSRVREAFVGSTAWAVVQRSPVPVLLRRIEAVRNDPEAALEVRASSLPDTLIHPTDFSDVAERAFPSVLAMVEAGVKRVVLLHVYPVGNDEARSDARARLSVLAERVRDAGCPQVDVEVRGGTPAEEILAVGGRNASDLVVMGTQGKGVLPALVVGSESRNVVRHAAAGVLLVPAGITAEPA
jgi:nucleotide-binding universal stress UspA family protein